jgi:pimeloyl-ACP methyl ester carboxylesterase
MLKAAVAVLAIVATLTTVDLAAGSAHAGVAAPTVNDSAAQLHWHSCAPPSDGETYLSGTECTTLAVLLDRHHPAASATMHIAVSRTPAKNRGSRQGVLLFNPGGPGQGGLTTPSADYAATTAKVRAAWDDYDLIGFDPRGTGQSDPVDCGLTPDQVLHSVPPYDLPGGTVANAAMARSIADACAKNAGSVLPFMSTADSARDIDALRAALGERRVSLYFESYGTALAVTYDTLFPGRTERVALDSVMDTQGQWQDQFEHDAAIMETRFDEFAGRAATNDAQFHLGATVPVVRRRYLSLVTRLNAKPVAIGGVTMTGGLLQTLLTNLLHTDTDGSDAPTPAALLQNLEAVPGAPTTAQVEPAVTGAVGRLSGAGQILSAALAIVCADSPASPDLAGYAAASARDAARYPITGGGYAQISPCAYWPVKPSNPRVRANADGPRNILLVTNSRDTHAPFTGALATRDALGSRAALVVSDDTSHILVGNHVACVDEATAAWFGAGSLPGHDLFCPGSASA